MGVVYKISKPYIWRSVVLLSLASHLAAQPQQSSQTARTGSISESEYIQIGGIEQWVTIRGENRDNPVVLILHGGPGGVFSPYSATLFHDWEKLFTVVQWDQRGAGRTYGKSGPSIKPTMTIPRMVQDGIEVSEFLRKHLGKKKIILTGGSWGSVLGVHMAKSHPDLFHTYVGLAQLVNLTESTSAGYARTLELARQAGDQSAIAELESIGPPPWNEIRKFGVWGRMTGKYESDSTDRLPAMNPPAEYITEQAKKERNEAGDFSQMHFIGMDLQGPLNSVNLNELGYEFRLPVFILQGESDLKVPPEVTLAYFQKIQAPQKQFIIVPRAGHDPSPAMMTAWLELMTTIVRPLSTAE